jgi:hypothetical protein
MGFERKMGRAALGLVLLLDAASAAAAPPEPLIVTQLADPDPNYVPPHEPKLNTIRASDQLDQGSSLDQSMQEFGRAIGQAAMLQQQAIEARCRSGAPSGSSTADRFAWEASCRYQRH